MDYYESIESALEYIEENIKNDIALQEIAGVAFLSPFHFHRIFTYMVGEPVMRYLKLRRLTCALEDIATTKKNILDIAIDYQFESEEVFLRAFKKQFGITPGEYRKSKKVINNIAKQNFSNLILKKIREGENFMNRILIVEVGSSNTKTHMVYEDGRLEILPLKYIGFKANYNTQNGFCIEDIKELKTHLKWLIDKYNVQIKICGTSVFRTANEEHVKDFVDELKNSIGVDFKVITQLEEIENTTLGVTANINKELTVLITGGGSTEIVKCKNGIITNSYHVEIGVEEIMKSFRELAEDRTKVDIDEVINYVKETIGDIYIDTEILVLAGGQHSMFADIVNYPLERNTFYDDTNQKYMISVSEAYEYDRKFYEEDSLDKLKKQTPENKDWWNGTRAARAIVEAFAKNSNVKYIVPTDVNMILGIAKKTFQNI